jgi:hypothetical protein
LDVACNFSSLEVVQLLLEAYQSAGGPPIDERITALFQCMHHRSRSVALEIATMFLDKGCPVSAVSARRNTLLMAAAFSSSPEMVSLLLSRGADVRERNPHRTALHVACLNGAFGREIIPLLCAAGADVTATTSAGESCFEFALSKCRAMAEAMIPFLPPGFRQERTVISAADPVGSLACAMRMGAVFSQPRLKCSNGIDTKEWWVQIWANVRTSHPVVLDDSEGDAFRTVLHSKDAELWKWVSREARMQQHPITGDTVFHLLCRTDALTIEQKLAVFADLKLHHRNPLTPNYRNELCVQLAKEPELKKALQEYACWQPHWQAMEWFGPLFYKRAFALLLVCYRFKKKNPKLLAGLNRDIRHLLVKYASRVEDIYVPFRQ